MSDARTATKEREGREECLEALYRLERSGQSVSWKALEDNPDLRYIDITATLLDLVERRDVRLCDGQIDLMASGRALGRRIYRRHELVERFLRILGLRRERAHREACRFEHITSLPGEGIAGLSERGELSIVVDLLSRGAVPLTQCVCGVPYRLGLICGGRGARRKLEDMGVSGGAEITLCSRQRGGPVEILVRGSRLALGRAIASKVLVVPASEHAEEGARRWHAGIKGSAHRGRNRRSHRLGHLSPHTHR